MIVDGIQGIVATSAIPLTGQRGGPWSGFTVHARGSRGGGATPATREIPGGRTHAHIRLRDCGHTASQQLCLGSRDQTLGVGRRGDVVEVVGTQPLPEKGVNPDGRPMCIPGRG